VLYCLLVLSSRCSRKCWEGIVGLPGASSRGVGSIRVQIMRIFRSVENKKIWMIEELARKSCSDCMEIIRWLAAKNRLASLSEQLPGSQPPTINDGVPRRPFLSLPLY
jgi:hypothetical protein